MTKKILYFDMDNVLVDFPSAFPFLTPEQKVIYKDNLDDVPHIFSKMTPLPGAIEAYKELSQLFDTYILSTAPWDNPTAWQDKVIWAQEYIGDAAYKRLILSHNKHLNKGDYLIDDRLANGADKFEGEHIHFGTEKFPDWETVVTYLKSKI